MSEIYWELIFINNKFKTYLNFLDFIELTTLSRLVRFKLAAELFENAIVCKNSKEYVISEVLKCGAIIDSKILYNSSEIPFAEIIMLLKQSIPKLLYYVKGVNIEYFANHYHLLILSHLLPQLTSLSICSLQLSLPVFKIVLNNLNRLDKLKLKNISFIEYGDPKSPIRPISLPYRMKYIYWYSVTAFHSNLEKDPLMIKFKHDTTLSESSEFLFKPDYFPNLKIFTCHELSEAFLEEFFTINPNLACLNIKLRIQDSIKVFNLVKGIKRLEILSWVLVTNINSIYLNFPNLTHLYIYINNIIDLPLLEKFSLSSPNLSKIIIEFSSQLKICPPFFKLLNKIPSLQKLTVKSEYNLNIIFEEFAPHPSLRYIEIWSNLDIYNTLLILSQCPNLKVVCFGKVKFYSLYLYTLRLQRIPQSWKYIKSNEFIKYHRI